MSPDGCCNENHLSITAPLAWTDFHFLKQFIGFPEANGPSSFWAGSFGGSYSAGAGLPSVPAERSLFPPFAHENGFLSWPTSSCPGQAECLPKTSFDCSVHRRYTKPTSCFQPPGQGKKTHRTVNPFPTKTLCRGRSAWVGWLVAPCMELEGHEPVILTADERDSKVAPSYLGKKYPLSFSVKTKHIILFSSSFLLVTLKLQFREKILLIEAKTIFVEILSLK